MTAVHTPLTTSIRQRPAASPRRRTAPEFEEGAGFHSFRRLFSKEMSRENPAVVARLGWKDTQMLLNVYTDSTEEEERSAMRRRRAH